MKQMKSIKAGAALAGICTLLLTGCGGQNPFHEMQDAMTKMSEKEASFQKEQGTLQSYEEKEQQLYEKMIQTTKDHPKTVSSLSDQALASAAKREEHLKTEKESMEKAKKEFEAVKESASRIKDEEVKAKADQTVQSIQKRYASYDQLYREYQKALKQDKHLYQSLKKKDLGYQELKSKLKSVNRSYSKVRKESKKFNQYTDQLNEHKQALYRAAYQGSKKS
ncbi:MULTISPECIES: YkyA family protein [Bacillus]|uniref:YkyA family protein n=1 Tax=Bacillus TaxID=1386 RepID=UPI00028D75CC|nr:MULTISPECIES: YkyA family protein [Bacillus]EKF36242.1 lipoprotein [Bacillus xiamenensis]MCW1836468.1 YkyA family protein [Bacillus xiamenensis]QGX66235.1 chromosome partitioning protein [Bacillus sp. ms-22]